FETLRTRGRGLTVLGWAAHERLEDREEQAAVLRHATFLADVARIDPDHGVFGKGGKGVVGLVREVVPVGQEENPWPARRFPRQVPAALKQLPSNLERDKRLTRAGRQ